MEYYSTILTMHIISAGIWLASFFTGFIFKKLITTNKQKSGERKFIILYLTFSNLFGMIGSVGILITGILLTAMNPGYGFFQMTANHWLLSKQIIMVVILALISQTIIPKAKKIRIALGADLESSAPISNEGYEYLNKLYKFGLLINSLVLLNFLFAITHRFFG